MFLLQKIKFLKVSLLVETKCLLRKKRWRRVFSFDISVIVTMASKQDVCVICQENHDTNKLVKIGSKGKATLKKVSLERKDTDVTDNLSKNPIYVHENCRKDYVSKKSIRQHKASDEWKTKVGERKRTRSQRSREDGSSCFSFPIQYLFCTNSINDEREKSKKKKSDETVHFVRTLDFDDSIKKVCEERQDDWSRQVYSRLVSMSDMHAADAVYHHSCSTYFRSGRGIPDRYCSSGQRDSKKRKTGGRPEDPKRHQAFLHAATFLLENDDETVTINDLCNVMKKCGTEPYCYKTMILKLNAHFNKDIVITPKTNDKAYVTLRKTARKVIQEFYNDDSIRNPEIEKKKIILAAVQLIKEDCKNSSNLNKKDCYELSLNPENAVDDLPNSIKLFLNELFAGSNIQKKVAFIGQAILQAVRPRAIIAPLQVYILLFSKNPN